MPIAQGAAVNEPLQAGAGCHEREPRHRGALELAEAGPPGMMPLMDAPPRERSLRRALKLFCFALAIIGGATLVGGSAVAAKPAALRKAKQYYKTGKAAFELGRFDEALQSYEKAYELAALPGLLFNIGQCYRNLGHLEKAIFSFRLYLRKLPDAPNRAAVETLIAELEAKIERRRAERQRQRRLEAERQRQLQLRLQREAAERRNRLVQPPPQVPDETPPLYRRWWFWTLVGVAVAGGAAGVYFGTQASKTSLPHSPFPTWELP